MFPNFISDGQGSTTQPGLSYPIPQEEIIYGIDVSWHNGKIDWEEVREHQLAGQPLHFAIIKATEGGDLIDPQFNYNWTMAKEQGLIRGAYHFFTAFTDPSIQAENYLNLVKHQKGDFLPVLDFEKDGRTATERRNLTANVLQWLQAVEESVGKKPVIYTNHHIFNKYIKDHFEGYEIWLADYSMYDPKVYGINQMIMWQLTDGGKVPGIHKPVDLNVFFGTTYKFQKYLIE